MDKSYCIRLSAMALALATNVALAAPADRRDGAGSGSDMVLTRFSGTDRPDPVAGATALAVAPSPTPAAPIVVAPTPTPTAPIVVASTPAPAAPTDLSSSSVALSTPTGYEAFVGAVRGTDGKVVAVGNYGTGLGSDLVLARFAADGRPDAAFGVGGIAFHDAGGRDDAVRAMTTLPDGRIVAVGQSGGRALIAAFRADGSLDPGFATGGWFRGSVVGAARVVLNAVSVKPDGGIVASGSALMSDGEHVVLFVLDANGALDRRFDLDGIRVVREALGTDARSALLADGRIVVAARAAGQLQVMRFLADGRLDLAFGGTGLVALPTSDGSPLAGLALAPEGYVVAERYGARLTLVDAAGALRTRKSLSTTAAATALARAADGRFAVTLATVASGGTLVEIGAATLQTVGPSTTRPATAAEVTARRNACNRIAAFAARRSCLATINAPVVVPGRPITPTFALAAKAALPVRGAEVLALTAATTASAEALLAGFVIDGADTDFFLNLSVLPTK